MSLAFSVVVGRRSRLLQVQRAAVRWLVLMGMLTSAIFALRLLFDASGLEIDDSWWFAPAIVATSILVSLVWQSKRGQAAKGIKPLAWLRGASDEVAGWLHVDEEGASSWQSQGMPTPVPVELSSWYLGRWIVSLRCRPIERLSASTMPHNASALTEHSSQGVMRVAPLELLLARDGVAAEQWRGLRCWLVWRQRGGRPGHTL